MKPFKDKKAMALYIAEHDEIYFYHNIGWHKYKTIEPFIHFKQPDNYAPIEPIPPEGYKNDGWYNCNNLTLIHYDGKWIKPTVYQEGHHYLCAIKTNKKTIKERVLKYRDNWIKNNETGTELLVIGVNWNCEHSNILIDSWYDIKDIENDYTICEYNK